MPRFLHTADWQIGRQFATFDPEHAPILAEARIAVVERLAKVDRVYGIAAVAVVATGVARTWWGVKGTVWYWTNPLLHLKLTLFIIVGVISIFPTMTYIRWRKTLQSTGALPAEAEIRKTRKLVMIQAHLIALIPLAAVFLARGFGVKS